ncbi:MAG: bifunctional diaminohydroxyphosphoribosylaminopyrimidine deaminase/5-amino-6-(5-phosphoribosylamino)uracil reductase RibD [Dehalococcoidia bacterium]|nr:bifunctional diaminohydroxyphosphoribosylaminopyrimidine deaminase/5-amino-6-(5-phosphoribosylamino)uracil reductase RibD [Dehalococcoidia bacterium]
MQQALDEARQALGLTSPNPAVGAVVVRDGRVLGRGRTQPPGGPHAEVVALREAGEAARGSTVYSTLEPCAHHGRTPPCVDALIGAGVAAVHYSLEDPNPAVSGAGHRRLLEAGIAVEVGDGAAEAARILEGYLKHQRTGLPLAVVKYAASLDGRLAAASGDSRWVSGPDTLRWAHDERQRLDAIVVGSGTVVLDNPTLTARPERSQTPGYPAGGATGEVHQPLRVVVDSRGRTRRDANVLGGPAPTLMATSERSPESWRREMTEAGAEVLVLPDTPGVDGHSHVDLEALLRELGRRGMLVVLFEGGGVLLGSLFDRKLVDRVYAVIAPVIIGARDAPAAVAGRGVDRMAQAPRLRDLTVTRLGEDTLISGVPVWPDATEAVDTAGRRD